MNRCKNKDDAWNRFIVYTQYSPQIALLLQKRINISPGIIKTPYEANKGLNNTIKKQTKIIVNLRRKRND